MSPIIFRMATVWYVFSLFSGGILLWAQTPLAPPLNSLNPQLPEELLNLKQLMGGGVAEVFSDSEYSQFANEAFRQELMKLQQQSANAAPQNLPRLLHTEPRRAARPQGLESPDPAHRWTSPGYSLQPWGSAVNHGSGSPTPWLNRCRNMARRLDELAADLEELELYDSADRIRGEAQILRRKARGETVPLGAASPTR